MIKNRLCENFLKNNIIKSFLVCMKKKDLELRIINKQLIVYYWKQNVSFQTIRFNSFSYEIPNYLNISFKSDKLNSITGIFFNFKGVSHITVLTQLKILYNLILGLINPYKKTIQIFGTGFKFILMKNDIYKNTTLMVYSGFNTPKTLIVPNQINIKLLDNTTIELFSVNKQQLTSFGSLIKNIKPINKYKLRGIKYENEVFVKKSYKKTK